MNRALSAPRAVSPGTYGAATAAINQILDLGHSLEFFPEVIAAGPEALELVRRHQQLYAQGGTVTCTGGAGFRSWGR